MAKNSSKTPPAADKVEDGPAPASDAPAATTGDTPAEPPAPEPADPQAAGDGTPVPADSEGDAGAPPEGDGDDAPPPAEPGETVPALVLSDNHLGKVGQVVQVPAAHAEQLRLGGLIDTHPAALAGRD
ncbi:MAG: hypothetical protein E2593_06920 [Stenotrophomonas sp.]|nr:hypothetical protein [Stenotrophomonas sp.]